MHIDLHAVDRDAQQAWQASAQLRAEFADNWEAFAAFSRAEARGQVRVLGAGAVQAGSTPVRQTPAASPGNTMQFSDGQPRLGLRSGA